MMTLEPDSSARSAGTMRHGRSRRLRRLVVMLAVSGVLAACSGSDLYSQLNERQANEIIAALQSAGITADKRSKDTVVWTVRVAQGDFARAVDTLRAQGLPREEFESLGRVFRKEGFVSSPLEERARLNYGMSQELSNTLSSIDGVLVARVHLAVPERDPLSDRPRPASASVMVKHRPGVDMSQHIGQIKALVVNSVEGLSYEHVTVTLFPAHEAAGNVARPAPPVRTTDRLTTAGLSLAAGGLAMGVAVAFGATRAMRRLMGRKER